MNDQDVPLRQGVEGRKKKKEKKCSANPFLYIEYIIFPLRSRFIRYNKSSLLLAGEAYLSRRNRRETGGQKKETADGETHVTLKQ